MNKITLEEQIEYMRREVEWNCATDINGEPLDECIHSKAILATLEALREEGEFKKELDSKPNECRHGVPRSEVCFVCRQFASRMHRW